MRVMLWIATIALSGVSVAMILDGNLLAATMLGASWMVAACAEAAK